MSQLRPRHHHNIGNGRGEVRLDIQTDSTHSSINFNYAKYGKKKKRIKKKSKCSIYVVFIIACFVYLIAVFTWSTSWGRQSSKPYTADSNSRQYYNNQSPEQNKQQSASLNHRLGERLASQKKYKDITITPQTVTLNDLTTTIASKKGYGYNNAKYDEKSAYYGDIEYQLRKKLHEPGFLKNILSDKERLAEIRKELIDIEGAFDADSIESSDDDDKKKKSPSLFDIIQKIKGNYHFNYSLSDGDMLPMKQKADDASYKYLKQYYDDDNVEVFRRANDAKAEEPRACRSAEFENFYFPTCNNFHELDLGRPYDVPEEMPQPRPENQLAKVGYLGHGYYRDVWFVEDNPWIWPSQYATEKDNKPKEALGVNDEKGTADLVTKAYRTMVLKTMRYEHKYRQTSFLEVQLEAIIMERLTKSPRIMNIYGHCGFAVSAELVPIEFEERVVSGDGYAEAKDVEERNMDGPRSYNDFTPEEKLAFALEMAESIADLHGFEDGVIVHDDVQLCQWMTTPDGRLKLGDFNRATIMQWDEIKGDYCMFNNGVSFGNYRAPEEFKAVNLNEQIDVFSFCNNIYALITGLWNFYDTEDDEVVHEKLIGGDLAFVDPRWKDQSYEERKLVELLPKCWAYDPNERISIFDAVKYLRQAVEDKPNHQD